MNKSLGGKRSSTTVESPTAWNNRHFQWVGFYYLLHNVSSLVISVREEDLQVDFIQVIHKIYCPKYGMSWWRQTKMPQSNKVVFFIWSTTQTYLLSSVVVRIKWNSIFKHFGNILETWSKPELVRHQNNVLGGWVVTGRGMQEFLGAYNILFFFFNLDANYMGLFSLWRFSAVYTKACIFYLDYFSVKFFLKTWFMSIVSHSDAYRGSSRHIHEYAGWAGVLWMNKWMSHLKGHIIQPHPLWRLELRGPVVPNFQEKMQI